MKSLSAGAAAVLGLGFLSYVCVMFCKMCPTVLALDLQRDLGLSAALLPMVSGAAILCNALMQVPSGLMTDRLGPSRTFMILFAVSGMGMLGFALSSGPVSALAGRVATGIGTAVLVPVLAVAATRFSPQTFGLVNSVVLTGGNMGVVLSMAPLAWACQRFGWRACLIAFALSILVLTPLMGLCFRSGGRTGAPPTASRPRPGVREALKVALGNRDVLMLLVWAMAVPGIIMAFGGLWWGPYLMQGAGMDRQTAGNVLSGLVIVNTVALPLSAWLSDRVLRSRRVVLLGSTLLGLAAVPCLMALSANPSPWPHVLAGLMLYVGCGGAVSVTYASAAEATPENVRGTVLGLVALAVPAGGVLIQVAFGLLLEVRGAARGTIGAAAYADVLWLFVILIAAGLFAVFRMRETFPGEAGGRRGSRTADAA